MPGKDALSGAFFLGVMRKKPSIPSILIGTLFLAACAYLLVKTDIVSFGESVESLNRISESTIDKEVATGQTISEVSEIIKKSAGDSKFLKPNCWTKDKNIGSKCEENVYLGLYHFDNGKRLCGISTQTYVFRFDKNDLLQTIEKEVYTTCL